MSKNVQPYISVNVSGDSASYNIGSVATPIATLVNSPAEHMTSSVSSGFTTILVPQLPSPAQYVHIIPPVGSAVSMFIMGSTSDVGVQLATALPSLISLSPSQTSFIIKAGGSQSVDLYFY